MKVLVLGGLGFIGSTIADAYDRRGTPSWSATTSAAT